jgi:NTE family protein
VGAPDNPTLKNSFSLWVRTIVAASTVVLLTAPASAQAAFGNRPSSHPKVAVALSGGSAKGMAHIGALAELEKMGLPIDIVTGTSMGALIGGLYSAGYSPSDLEAMVKTENWDGFFKRPTDRKHQSMTEKDAERFAITFPLARAVPGLPAGAVSRQSIAQHVERYLWPLEDLASFATLPTNFGALVTELGTGKPVLLHSGSLSQAIEGSAAVPGVFAPLTLADGRRVIDGAVNRNIPAEDARTLGADIIVCVDVSEQILPVARMHTLIDIVDQTVAFRVQMSNTVEKEFCNITISPDVNGISSADFGLGEQWITRGRTAALASSPQIIALVDSLRRLGVTQQPRRARLRGDSIFINEVRWNKLSVGANSIAEGSITLQGNRYISQRQVEAQAIRAFSTGRFDQVSYRLVQKGNTRDLVFDLTEGDHDLLGIGVRYDTPRGAALLASVSVADFLSPGSVASLSARLGKMQEFEARDVLGEGVNARFLQSYSAMVTHTVLPVLSTPGAYKPFVLDVQHLAAEISHAVVNGVYVGGELKHEWSRDGARGADAPFQLRPQSFTTVAGTIDIDTRDKEEAATRGYAVFGRSEFGTRFVGSNASFSRHVVRAEGALALMYGVSLTGGIHVGTAQGVDLPLHDLFYVGGSVPTDVWSMTFVPFLGSDPQSVAGRGVRIARGGVQSFALHGFVASVLGDVGKVLNPLPAGSPDFGYRRALGVNVRTQLTPGPMSLTVSSRALHAQPLVELTFGTRF